MPSLTVNLHFIASAIRLMFLTSSSILIVCVHVFANATRKEASGRAVVLCCGACCARNGLTRRLHHTHSAVQSQATNLLIEARRKEE
jgi:hypothetical protein